MDVFLSEFFMSGFVLLGLLKEHLARFADGGFAEVHIELLLPFCSVDRFVGHECCSHKDALFIALRGKLYALRVERDKVFFNRRIFYKGDCINARKEHRFIKY